MHWPSRGRNRRATRPAAHADTPSPIDDALSAPHELNEQRDPTGPADARSQPRADWTRAAPIRPVIATPPVTVDTARFEHALAGMRDMTHPHRRHRGGLAPAGVLLDVSRVESVIAPGGDDGGAARPVAVADTPIHRRLLPQRSAHERATLTESDLSVPFAGHEPTPTPSLERVAWTIEDGFVEPDATSPPRTRTVRHRPVLATESERPDERPDDDDPASDEDASDENQSPALRFVAAHGARRERAPRDLADVVARVTGVDVGDAEIDRSPAASQEAAAIGAVAFTRRGTVHLPAELGPIDSPDVRAVTAHELVHVAQQRLVSDVPDESSAEGRALESEALAVQRMMLGGSVAPTFLRRSGHRPTQAPLTTRRHGVQRLADDADPSADETGWTGDDYSDADLSDIEPGGPFDPFAWQERDGEPTDDGWEERRDWAERFETENADELQRRRDARYYQLIDDATGRERERLGRRAVMSLRRQLDAEMPYQFGPPSLVEPYPEPLPVTTPDGSAPDGPASDGPGAVVVASLMSSILAGIELRHVRADARRAAAGGAAAWSDDDTSAGERRLDREREVRLDVLEQKRARAAAGGAPATHVVALSDVELAQIRAAIDHELPTDDADRRYLDDDEAVRLSVGGVLDAEPPAPRQGEHRRAPSSPADVDAADSASSGWLRARPAPVAFDDTADEQALAGRGALRDITDAAIAAAPPDWTSGVESPEERSLWLAQRQRRERSMRQYVLRAKVLAAIGAGARPGTEVLLTDSELASIRAALDVELPLGDGEFDDEGSAPVSSSDDVGSTSYAITAADVAELGPAARRRNRAGAAADDDTAEFDAADVADEVSGFADFLPGGIADVVGAGFEAFGIAGAVPGALSTLFGIDVTDGDDGSGSSARTGHSGGPQPVADDELSANVVESLTELDLEVLTRKLWRRVRREIRGELLIDRERAGVLADFR